MATGLLAQHVKAFEDHVRTHSDQLVDTDDVFRGINLLVSSAFLLGDMACHGAAELGTLKPEPTPKRCQAVRTFASPWGVVRVLVGIGWIAVVRQSVGGETTVSVAAHELGVVEAVMAELRSKAVKPKKQPGTVELTFVHDGRNGIVRSRKRVGVSTWPSIRRNYAASAQPTIDALMALTPDTLPAGRLLLMQGPTGTGKSTLVRSLATAWADWCSVEVLLDPDRFLSQPAYLNEVALNGRDAADDRWRLIVLEDCDEYFRSNAKAANGASVARLLNVTDGIVSHGARLLVCLTTAEPLAGVHPSVRHPGRCIADVTVPRLSKGEAKHWLGHVALPTGDQTDGSLSLAEVYAASRRPRLVRCDEPYVSGIYL